MAAKLAIIFFTMILTNNYVLVNFLGICPFLGVSKRLDSSVGMGLSVTAVMVLATAVTWPVQQLLDKFGLSYLQTIAFILIIAVLVLWCHRENIQRLLRGQERKFHWHTGPEK